MPEPTESRITQLLGSRYELIELIGTGGFASVYRVRNLRLQRTEALKVLSEALTEDADFAKRFEQEARVAAALDHPNIVKIYDYGAVEDFFWFSMQFIGGASVGRKLKSRGPFEDAAAARIGIGVLDALAYSHARGVIHRDIKPDNILLDHEERPYLTDFGVAKSQIALVKTHAGTLLGSPAYMSPEQLLGKPLDGRSDLYSVGVTLYRMLCGALPFTGDDTLRATMKRLSENPEPLLSRRSDVHPILAEIVMRALERDASERFPDALSMREELEIFVTEVTPPRATRSSTATRRASEATPTSPRVTAASPDAPTVATASGSSGDAEPALPASLPGGGTAGPRRPVSGAALLRMGWIALSVAIAALVAVLALVRPARRRPEQTAPSTRSARDIARAAPTPRVAASVPESPPSPAATAPGNPARSGAEEPTARPALRATRPPRRAALSPTRAPTFEPTAVPTPVAIAAPQLGKLTPPEIIQQAPVTLSPGTAAAHHNESIGMVVIIGADGNLKSARVISPVCPECDRAALEAVHRFRFRPAMDSKGNAIEGSFGFAIRIP